MPQQRKPVKSIGELLQAMTPARKKWGNWRLVATHLKLVYGVRENQIECELDKMHDSASMLDFIFRFNTEKRATAADKESLLNALHDLVDPLTCFGSEHELAESSVLRGSRLAVSPEATVDIDRNGDVE